MKKRIILVGPGGSGKNFFADKLISIGYTLGVQYTTRPKRPGEFHGKDYYFVSEEEYSKMSFAVDQRFTRDSIDYMYGYTFEELNNKDLFIMTPGYLDLCPKEFLDSSLVIYLDSDARTKLDRMSRRATGDENANRLRADFTDFDNFSNYDIKFTT